LAHILGGAALAQAVPFVATSRRLPLSLL
jgi:hypothetical protein